VHRLVRHVVASLAPAGQRELGNRG
jgi:hypothetical protein